MTYSSIFGLVVGREQIEQAVLSLLQTPPAGSTFPLIVYYLAEVERQRGLQAQTLPLPPGINSYRSGADFNVFEEEWAPQITVVAQPEGDAERYDDGIYGQWYEIEVAATVTEQDEDTVRLLADRYGAALMLLLTQNGGLGNPAGFTVDKSVLVGAPRTSFPDDRIRRLMRTTVIIRSFVEQVVQENGPTSLGANPYVAPANWPTITTVDITLTPQRLDGTTSSQSGATVTEPVTGGGQIVVSE